MNDEKNIIRKIIEYLKQKFPENVIKENTLLMEMFESSIKFIETLCELEEVFDIEIHLEDMDDITKVTICDLEKYSEEIGEETL